MKSVIKLALLLFVLNLFVSCGFLGFSLTQWHCPDDSKNLGSNLKFGIYRGEEESYVIIANETNQRFSVPAKETLFLYEDSTFAYFAIAKNDNNDTIKKVSNGSFRIYQDIGFPWYVLELKSDSIYERTKLGSSYSEDFVISDRAVTLTYFPSVEANLLSDVDDESGCFSLATKINPYKEYERDNDFDFCDKMILIKRRTFCLEQSQNSTGDNL